MEKFAILHRALPLKEVVAGHFARVGTLATAPFRGRVAGATSPVYEEVHKLLRYATKKRHEAMSKRNAPSRL